MANDGDTGTPKADDDTPSMWVAGSPSPPTDS